MPHSLGQVYVHLVFSTRNRIAFLTDTAMRGDLYGYMTGIFRRLGCPSLRIGGADDHVHALFRLSRVKPIVQVVRELKRGSSTWLGNRGFEDFEWQEGYGAFSVSPEHVGRVTGYIRNQEAYHCKATFDDEYREFLQRSGGLENRVDVHLVFSTKNRVPFLTDKGMRLRLHNWLETLCRNLGCPSLRTGGTEDHVHILYRLSPEQTLARVTQEIKKRSTRWLMTSQDLSYFDWQEGYGALSVSPRHVPAVIRYIANQEEHHRQETFVAECGRILRHSGIKSSNTAIWE